MIGGPFRGELHPRDRRGKFRGKPGDPTRLRGRNGRPLSADAARAVARAAERVRPLAWRAPPAPERAGGRGHGYSSDEGLGTNTDLGRLGERAFVAVLGGRVLHPPGRGEQSPLDVSYDGLGFEVKACSRRAQSFKATPKPHEREQKERFARELGVAPALAIVVVDPDGGEAHAYYREGLDGGRLSARTGWRYLGSTPLDGLPAR